MVEMNFYAKLLSLFAPIIAWYAIGFIIVFVIIKIYSSNKDKQI